jgi:hypothetical protein
MEDRSGVVTPTLGAPQEHGTRLRNIAQQVAGSALATYMILAVGLSAIGSTLATLVSGVREVFAMGTDGVLPRALARSHPRFETPSLATVVLGVLAVIGTWIYILGSSSVQNSFSTIVSVDGLLFVEVHPRPRRLGQRQPHFAVCPAGSGGSDHDHGACHQAIGLFLCRARGVPALS